MQITACTVRGRRSLRELREARCGVRFRPGAESATQEARPFTCKPSVGSMFHDWMERCAIVACVQGLAQQLRETRHENEVLKRRIVDIGRASPTTGQFSTRFKVQRVPDIASADAAIVAIQFNYSRASSMFVMQRLTPQVRPISF